MGSNQESYQRVFSLLGEQKLNDLLRLKNTSRMDAKRLHVEYVDACMVEAMYERIENVLSGDENVTEAQMPNRDGASLFFDYVQMCALLGIDQASEYKIAEDEMGNEYYFEKRETCDNDQESWTYYWIVRRDKEA